MLAASVRDDDVETRSVYSVSGDFCMLGYDVMECGLLLPANNPDSRTSITSYNGLPGALNK
jgi:hypothetical protein